MSDWEDEPKSGRSFGDQGAKNAKDVSGWSDDDNGGGDKGGYRRGGDRSGGFRGRRDDENGLSLATKPPPIPPSCNKDVVTAFINCLDLCKHITTLDEVRELRDYLYTAFRDLVYSEWDRLDSLDRAKRTRKTNKVRQAAAMIDSLIMDINEILAETEVGKVQEHDAVIQLQQMGINWDQNAPNLDTWERVIPQTTSEISDPRRSSRAIRSAEPASYKVQPIINTYENARQLDEEEQQSNGVFGSGEQENYTEVAVSESPQTYGFLTFSHNLSAGFLNRHKMRGPHFGNLPELTSRMSWPIAPTSGWLGLTKSYHIIHSFDEEPMNPTSEPPPTEKRVPDKTSSIQTSRQIDVIRHHRSQNESLETQDGVYFSRNDATCDEETAWSASGGITGVVAAEQATSSTPIKRHADLGLSMNLSMIHNGGLTTSTPAEGPAMPEFPLGSIADNGTLIMSVDNEETAVIGAVASSSEVHSVRHGGVLSASTPRFRPLLPVINEERNNLNQALQSQQFVTRKPRTLELTTNEVTLAEPPAIPPAIPPALDTQSRDWGLIFRAREQIINYSEGSAMPRRPLHRRRRRPRHRARIPATDVISVETQQQQNEVEEQVEPTISSQEITRSFMANLIQKASDAVSPLQHKTKTLAPAASASTTLDKSANNLGVDQMELNVIEKNHEPAESFVSKSQTSVERTFQKPRCLLKAITMDTATKDAENPSPTVASSFINVLETLADPPGFNDTMSYEKVPALNTSNGILNISEMHLEQPNLPAMEIENSLANVSERANVTDIQILMGPITMATSSSNLPTDRSLVAFELVELEERPADSLLYGRKSVEDLKYIVQHVDMLRLNIDRQKELSLTSESPESPSKFSMPALKVFDPKFVVNMPQVKIRLFHKVMGALVKQYQVDMRSTDFIRSRMDAAATFRLLLDLKAANIINLTKDGRIFSLK